MLFADNTKVKSRSSSKNRAAKKEQAEVLDGRLRKVRSPGNEVGEFRYNHYI